ncbi:hypothetical protein AB0903_30010 [Streptomyces sp. NPDC048389]|uniref:hypothetical protein n=1 Tax=Streptomyces sp. NPDC048389 TaxID=3154622 RepID=UPI003452E6ED
MDANAGTYLHWKHPTWPGFPVTPGMRFWWWAPAFEAVEGATMRLHWRNAEGVYKFYTSRDAAHGPLSGLAPADMVYVTPIMYFANAGLHQIGPSVFRVHDPSSPDVSATETPPLGEGCPAMSITGYTHAAMQGNGDYRDIGLTLVEVTNSALG